MDTEQDISGSFLYKTNCDECGSSDANAVYSTGTTYCFSCGVAGKEDLEEKAPKKDTGFETYVSTATSKVNTKVPTVVYKELKVRGISKKVAEYFSYGTANGKHCAIYYDKDGKKVAYKFRSKDKKFTWSGQPKEAALFGQQCFQPNPKLKLVITEGELDALSVAQAQSSIYPVVSLPNGAASAKRDIKKHYEYLNGFKELIVMFDMDEAGQKAAQEIIKMFPPKYAKIAKLPMKDANELLVAGKGREIVSAIFEAEAYKPESLKSGNDLIDLLDLEDDSESFPLLECTPLLNTKMFGMRLAELTVITAGSGSGKTTFVKELQHHYYKNTKLNQGIIHLEEKLDKTMTGLVSIALKRRLSLVKGFKKEQVVRDKWTEIANAVDEDGNKRVQILDTFGSMDTDDVYDMIRYLAKVEGCQVIYLDHISMLVSGMKGNIDERRALDNIMTELASLTQELNVHIFAISHLNNNTTGKPFEEGGRATVNNLRGSGALKQLAFNIISLRRNQMAESDRERNTIDIDLLKCRETGDTGATDKVLFNTDTGCLEELDEMSPFDTPTTSTSEKDF